MSAPPDFEAASEADQRPANSCQRSHKRVTSAFAASKSAISLYDDDWAPMNWIVLDKGDIDLGGSGALLADVAGATPSQLAVSHGKDGNAYLLNRTNLGGVSVPVAQAHVSNSEITSPRAPLPP
jgi:hypothetical protein